MNGVAERGMSALPELVFNTATDPDRTTAWLPGPFRDTRSPIPQPESRFPVPGEAASGTLRACWRGCSGQSDWTARLRVDPDGAGGARARLELETGRPERQLDDIADESLADLDRAVTDNLTAG